MKTDCRHFSGYKPCKNHSQCDSCQSFAPVLRNILIVHLGAIGAVLRSTSLLQQIKSKFPGAAITWITDRPSDQLLAGHPDIDRVCTSEPKELQALQGLDFETAYVIDKSPRAVGIVQNLNIRVQMGFRCHPLSGGILPANSEAEELWSLGLSNQKKFFDNKKSEVQLVAEALALIPEGEAECFPNESFQYSLPLSPREERIRDQRSREWRRNIFQPIIGINTGCSEALPAKKLGTVNHLRLIQKLQQRGFENLILLGGPEDEERNHELSGETGVPLSPHRQGLRDGLVSIAACDLVITGDSLGLHMAISQKVHPIAWFGPSCSQEIEMYGLGQKMETRAPCSPCWKKNCEESVMCYDLVDLDAIVRAVVNLWERREPLQSRINFQHLDGF